MINILNMIRLKISNFIKRHEGKIKDLGKKLIIVAIVVIIATIVISSFSGQQIETDNSNKYNVYKPTETVIKGSDVSQEQFEKDSNLVNTFLEYCNNKKVEEAYNLLSDACKEESYQTVEIFRNNYYNIIFDKKREFNLQAWITTKEYIIYKIRYSNSMLSTGTYDEENVYEDYITLNRKGDTDKISIGNFVDSKECNTTAQIDEIAVSIIKKRQYMLYEEYELHIQNKTNKTILVNNLKKSGTIKLITSSGTEYSANFDSLFITDLLISPEISNTITLKFRKRFSANSKSSKIIIKDIIKDYDVYSENEEEYQDTTSIEIKVED